MVLRKDGWRVIASVAVCLAAAGAVSGAVARDLRDPPRPRADVPFPHDTMTTGATQPTLVWGGPVPPEPIPGEAPVYVPSQSVVPSTPQPQPQFAPPADFSRPEPEPEPEIVDEPEPSYAPAEEIYREAEPEPTYELPPPEPRRQAKPRLSDENEPGFEPHYRAGQQAAPPEEPMGQGRRRLSDEDGRLPPPSDGPVTAQDAPPPRADDEPAFYPPASDDIAADAYPGDGEAEPQSPVQERRGAGRRAQPALEPIDGEEMDGAPLYQARDAAQGEWDPPARQSRRAAPASIETRMGGEEDALPPLDAPVEIDDGSGGAGGNESEDLSGYAGAPVFSPGGEAPVMATPPGMARPLILEGRVEDLPPEEIRRAARLRAPDEANQNGANQGGANQSRAKRSIFDFGRGALEQETPTGYRTMPQSEAMCRRQLQKLGVKFVDASSISSSRSCGIDHPVKIHDIAPGIAMRPSATLNCAAALRVAQWMKDEVKPAARWKMLKRPTVLINASSYRCSRIAGSRSVSEHASGSALDVRGFKFSDGSIMEIEKKGFFSFREKGFQRSVRESACRYFGTVLGPGYNEDHADHLHLDTKQRRRAVCK